MSNILHLLQVAAVFLLMITVLVAAHELGHYLFARLFGMGVSEFSLGFGRPKVWTWRRTKTVLEDGSELETEFNIRAWPLGGFVKIIGMDALSEDADEKPVPNGFYSRAPWKRLVVLVAGPAFSVIAGLLILAPIYMTAGAPVVTTRIEGMDRTYGAYAAGLRPNDVVTAVDGARVRDGYDVITRVRDHLKGDLRVDFLRGGQPLSRAVTPKVDTEPKPVLDARLVPTGEKRVQARLGIAFASDRRVLPFGSAVEEGLDITGSTAVGVVRTITHPQDAKENGVGGVITMVRATDVVVSDSIEQTLFLAAMLSISIGLFNLLPIPPLDGGQMVIAFLEMLRGGRRVSARFQIALMNTGSLLLLVLFVGVLALDVSRVVGPKPDAKAPETIVVAPPSSSQPAPKSPK